jgi:hypothetical protein
MIGMPMNQFFSKTKLAIAVALSMSSGAAMAEVITIHQTINLPSAVPFYHGLAVFSQDALFNSPLLIRQGDTVDLTINFAPGQRIYMEGQGEGQAFAMSIHQDNNLNAPNSSDFTITNTSFNLLGQQGSFPAMVNLPNLSGGHSAIFTNPNGQFLAAGEQSSFTGMHARFTVSYLQNGESYYRGTSIYAYSQQLSVQAVPEPETWAMLFGGLGLLAGTSKNRRERRRYCAEKRSFASAKRGSQVQEMPAQ